MGSAASRGRQARPRSCPGGASLLPLVGVVPPGMAEALVSPLTGPAVSPGPERALRAGGTLIIDTLLVWTADDPVRHHDRLSTCLPDEREHLLRHICIVANIATF